MAAYSKPRSVNLVSIFMGLFAIALVYGGWKFGPKYYQALEVDAALESILPKAGRIGHLSSDSRSGPLLEMARQRIIEAGVDPQALRVYYGANFKWLHADYGVIVEHPFGPPTVLKFHREEELACQFLFTRAARERQAAFSLPS